MGGCGGLRATALITQFSFAGGFVSRFAVTQRSFFFGVFLDAVLTHNCA